MNCFAIQRVACTVLLAASHAASATCADEARLTKTTHVYKSVDPVDIRADVYRHEGDAGRPCLVWYHGGGLVLGSRTSVPRQLLDVVRSNRFVLVSMDYRLAPETKLTEILEDVRDGLAWIRRRGPALGIDPSRIVVAGASAGGYLALSSGVVAKPRPTAIVSYWGFGDINGDWTTKPNASYRRGKLVDRSLAWSSVGKRPLTATSRTNGPGRSRLFVYLKQTGGWLEAVSGLDPVADAAEIERLCPVHNVSAEYPPTLLLHGTDDLDVPVQQSKRFADALRRKEVPVELITIDGGGHSLWGGDKKDIERAFTRSQEFIRDRLAQSSSH